MTETATSETKSAKPRRFDKRSVTASIVAGVVGIVLSGAAGKLVNVVTEKVETRINPPKPESE